MNATVFLDFEVTDVDALAAYTVKHLGEAMNMSEEDAREIIIDSDGEIDPGRCLRLICDPGSVPGAKCHDSSAEIV